MSRTLRIRLAGLLALLLVGGAAIWNGLHRTAPPPGFALLSPDEIAEIARYPAASPRNITVTEADGPVIKVAAPSGFALSSPVDFDIQIQPRGGIAVDMTSLRIEYRLGPAWVNLTHRVMRQATIKGSHFYARGAELPPGNHALRLTVRDEMARTTRALVTFSVVR